MADPFLGEIRIFACSFAPSEWALCNGQLLSVAQHTALFALFGITYGGDGKTTFGLPNLQGASPVGQGQGPGLSPYDHGQQGGSPTVTLNPAQVPPHPHSLRAEASPGDLNTPSPQASLARSTPRLMYKTAAGATTQPMAAGILGDPVGGNGPHNNLMPYLTLNFCVALQGIFPSQT